VHDAAITPPTPAPHRRAVRARRRLAIGLVGVVIAALFGLRESVGATPAVIAASALIPAAGFSALILLLDGRDPIPWMPLLAALLWGGTAAALGALALNDAALRVLPAASVSAWVGPLVEEIAKGSALVVVVLVWRDAVRGVREGIVYGALVCFDSAATENLGYYMLAVVQGGTAGLARALYLRGILQGLNHAAFTAIVGAAVGYARAASTTRPARVRVVLSGIVVAVAVHAAWNGLASPAINTILCNAPSEGAACAPAPTLVALLVSVPVLVGSFIGPVAVLLVVLALRDRRSPA